MLFWYSGGLESLQRVYFIITLNESSKKVMTKKVGANKLTPSDKKFFIRPWTYILQLVNYCFKNDHLQKATMQVPRWWN